MKTTKLFLTIIFSIVIHNHLNAQVTQEWAARYNGSGNSADFANAMATDAAGNVYVTGQSFGSNGTLDAITIKYNLNGDSLWVRSYNGPANRADFGNSICVNAAGDVYVAGESESSSSASDFITIKYNSSGIQQWVSRYNGTSNAEDEAWKVALDNSGNVYVTGLSKGPTLNFDFVSIKYDPDTGNSIWVKRLSDSSSGTVYMTIDSSGNIYVTGYASANYLTVKYNSSGVQQWINRYGLPGNNNDIPHAIAVDRAANLYVTGSSSRDSGQNYDYATIKYNSSGVQQWAARYNGTANYHDNGNSVAVDNSGNVYVTGQSLETGTTNSSCTTIKYSSSGVQQWIQSYSGPTGINATQNTSNSIALDASGNVYVAGECVQLNSGYDYITVKYNPSGTQQWIKFYSYISSYDRADIVMLDASGNVYVTGSSFGSGSSYDFATIKYSQTTGITNISTETPKAFSLSQNYPNPFNPTTMISYTLTNLNYVLLKVYDTLGNEIETLVNEKQNPGEYKVEFNAANLPSGIYYYKLKSGDISASKKMIVLK